MSSISSSPRGNRSFAALETRSYADGAGGSLPSTYGGRDDAILPARKITRRGRRRFTLAATVALLGLSTPVWVPRLLATLPAFRVEEVRVSGTRYSSEDEIVELAAVAPDASTLDDPEPWLARVRRHPLVREASIRRDGFRAMEITVLEKHPVALVATPRLRPVSGEGELLPLDPSVTGLDLPIVQGPVETDGEVVSDPGVRAMIAALERLERTHGDFVSLVSEVTRSEEGGYRFYMLPGAGADIVLLPREDQARAIERISVALGQMDDPAVARADARFSGQVVLTSGEER